MTAAHDSAPDAPVPMHLRLVSSENHAPSERSAEPPRNGTAPAQAAPVSEEEFRRALAVHAAGVVVVTARPEGVPVGLTATSFSSVSLDPPLVSFYVAQSSTTWPALRLADHFAVNVLAGDQADVAARFAKKDIDRFAHPTRWSDGPRDVPLLHDVSAHLICRPHHTVEVGDHILVVGLVTSTSVSPAGRPLLYHKGRFGRFLPY
ncbi:hypothetical protein GCM10023194_77920 [Planotetraspora phitsanulokensis]|uniref:Flavin reductase like domain-containing protein n=1 Tax=Planotetraspora phitsanulokensis TaxID=575192 RepID=A0A8J3XIM6_9ACTN|nr:flavin reductase family protein [Planotetraspora phitsanulokensis]GII43327.1 hypothetical protein Pph01_83300 [Planotetraspora phitsanulokensis]